MQKNFKGQGEYMNSQHQAQKEPNPSRNDKSVVKLPAQLQKQARPCIPYPRWDKEPKTPTSFNQL